MWKKCTREKVDGNEKKKKETIPDLVLTTSLQDKAEIERTAKPFLRGNGKGISVLTCA